MTCWGITDGSAGAKAQVRALAQALGHEPQMKTVRIAKPYAWLPNGFYSGVFQNLLPHFVNWKRSDALTRPWPEIIISCGRRGALAALAIRASLRGTTAKLIHIHDPRMPAGTFDAVVAMEHDRIEGPNVIKTEFALHAITPQALKEAHKRFAERFASYPEPRIAVLIGGSTNKYRLSRAAMAHVLASLKGLLDATPKSLLVTPSRRTGKANVALLSALAADEPHIYVYDPDGEEENPYLGLLAMAEIIIVTNDSVNMMSEAAATGKPMYVLRLLGHEGTRPARFAEKLIGKGIARPLAPPFERWSYAAGNEMERVVKEVRRQLQA